MCPQFLFLLVPTIAPSVQLISRPTSQPSSQPSYSAATLWKSAAYPKLLSSIADAVTLDDFITSPQYGLGLVSGNDVFENSGDICSGWEMYLYSTLLRHSDGNIGVGLSFGIQSDELNSPQNIVICSNDVVASQIIEHLGGDMNLPSTNYTCNNTLWEVRSSAKELCIGIKCEIGLLSPCNDTPQILPSNNDGIAVLITYFREKTPAPQIEIKNISVNQGSFIVEVEVDSSKRRILVEYDDNNVDTFNHYGRKLTEFDGTEIFCGAYIEPYRTFIFVTT